MAAKIADYIESGLDAETIIQQFRLEDEKKQLSYIEGNDKHTDEVFPDEIMIISQALAYRPMMKNDIFEVYKLLHAAYQSEINGDESFRNGESIELPLIESLFNDPSYNWLIVEAPSGRNIELDGIILGVCCYTTDGIFKYNGQIEGTLGSIRFLGILPRYHGFCIGRRLLERIENVMRKANCCRIMLCIVETRQSMIDWIQRRKYERYGSVCYPTNHLGHQLKNNMENIELIRFIKSLNEPTNTDITMNDTNNSNLSTLSNKNNNLKPLRDKLGRVINNNIKEENHIIINEDEYALVD